MIDINNWITTFLDALTDTFGDRVWFVGLQGSYGRGEAAETSDIDIVVILNQLSASDIHVYNAMLDGLPHRELICGFLSGKDELLNWESSDLFQFYYDTTPIKGSLDELLTVIDESSKGCSSSTAHSPTPWGFFTGCSRIHKCHCPRPSLAGSIGSSSSCSIHVVCP